MSPDAGVNWVMAQWKLLKYRDSMSSEDGMKVSTQLPKTNSVPTTGNVMGNYADPAHLTHDHQEDDIYLRVWNRVDESSRHVDQFFDTKQTNDAQHACQASDAEVFLEILCTQIK
eukprot:CAMPEP_0180701010 /NCGR_PEP_ID=MMETSP1038_2-20121128/5379_1 /TAXON_ID=632150 /ORGANISM="Azadinium spinosum, Strain 3D9" /LENGTH=114 /DNA_ID=CAMNT_0022732717 /DNA_START=1005 /DNA_END=1349 /DNA_ORIENTATION=-